MYTGVQVAPGQAGHDDRNGQSKLGSLGKCDILYIYLIFVYLRLYEMVFIVGVCISRAFHESVWVRSKNTRMMLCAPEAR